MGEELSDLAAPAAPIILVSSGFSLIINSTKILNGIYTVFT